MRAPNSVGQRAAIGMTLRQVKAFLSVAACRNVTAAACELHMSQPGLSRVVKELEHQTGEVLFERIGGRMKLTTAGEVLLPFARKLACAYDEALRNGACAEVEGLLLAGSSAALAVVMPSLLLKQPAGLTAQALTFQEMSSYQALEEVRAGRANVGLCMPWETIPDLVVVPLLKSPLGLLTGLGVRLPESIDSVDQLRGLRFARLSEDMVLPRMLEASALELPAYFESRVVSRTMNGLFSVVAEGLCATLVSAVAASAPVASGLRFVALPHLLPSLNLCLVHRPREGTCWVDAVAAGVHAATWHEANERL